MHRPEECPRLPTVALDAASDRSLAAQVCLEAEARKRVEESTGGIREERKQMAAQTSEIGRNA